MANKKEQAPLTIEEVSKTEAFFDKYKKTIIYGIVAVIVIIAGVIVYNTYVAGPREDKSSTNIAKAQDYFSQEDYEKALKGDGKNAGFITIAEDYSGTDAGNLANLYAGLCYAQTGKWTEAAKYLENYSAADDQMVSPAAQGALGNTYAHLKQFDKAVEALKKAAKMADNNSLSPTFLIQAGEILESQGKKDEALKLYQQVKAEYVNSMAYQTIDKYIERVSK